MGSQIWRPRLCAEALQRAGTEGLPYIPARDKMITDIPYQEILREALKEGGEFADLFFEQTHSVVIICEEDRIEKVISGLDKGVGLRILFGKKTFYGFTTEISKASLFNLANRISRSAKEGERKSPRVFRRHIGPQFHLTRFPSLFIRFRSIPRDFRWKRGFRW